MSRTIEAALPKYSLKPIVLPYAEGFDYGLERRRQVAGTMASSRGLADPRELEEGQPAHTDRNYLIIQGMPTGPEIGEALGLSGPGAEKKFLGGWGRHKFILDKGVAHGTLGPNAKYPEGFNPQLGHDLLEAEFVLPGITAFRKQDVFDAAILGLDQFVEINVKSADGSNKERQWKATSLEEVTTAISLISEQTLKERGVLIEPYLQDPNAYIVGQDVIGEEIYSYVGPESRTIYTNEQGETVEAYGGAPLRVIRGPMKKLLKLGLPDDQEEAVKKAIGYHNGVREAYGQDVLVTPVSMYDVLIGDLPSRSSKRGKRVSGVVDPSPRLGGVSMALAKAQGILFQHPDVTSVLAESSTRYGNEPLPPNHTEIFNINDSFYGEMKFGTKIVYSHSPKSSV